MKKAKYIISLSLILTLVSCGKEFLELENPNQQTTGTFWQSEEDALKAINSTYQTLTMDGLYMRLYPWIQDVRSDECYNTSPWWIEWVVIYVAQPDNPCYYTSYGSVFEGVWRTNQVLDNVPGIDMDEALRERIIAEAKFLRALYYYHGTILYKDIPLILKTPQTAEDFYPKQATSEEIWAQVYKDLIDAMDVLPTKQEYPASDMGRATKGAAAGFLAKSYMFNHEWALAEPILRGIIEQEYGNYSLVDNYRDNFTTANENNSESLFEIQFNKSLGGTTLGWVGEPGSDWSKTSGKARTYAPLGFGWGDITPTDWIFEEYQQDSTIDGEPDPRLRANFLYDYPGSTVYGKSWASAGLIQQSGNVHHIHLRKYLNDDTDPDEVEWRSEINERILRYADILLLYAECLNELGRTDEAYQYIQEVRSRANLPDLATKKPDMTQEEMRLQISHERAVELCFEAQRYVDLLRWGWLDATQGENPMLDMLITHDQELAGLYDTPGREYLAIPQSELDVNPNMTQNPHW
ncbi:MAG: RagB/SusD family nutrient uptake outer membrane protein [Bacteroidales bacterium]|nr:RagB/SusD family nutrient uptake outer membrane protein [Bacteroidales bacterium]